MDSQSRIIDRNSFFKKLKKTLTSCVLVPAVGKTFENYCGDDFWTAISLYQRREGRIRSCRLNVGQTRRSESTSSRSPPLGMTSPLSPAGLADGPLRFGRGSLIQRERRWEGKFGRGALLSCAIFQGTHDIKGPLPMGVFYTKRHTFLSEIYPSPGHKFPFHHPPSIAVS